MMRHILTCLYLLIVWLIFTLLLMLSAFLEPTVWMGAASIVGIIAAFIPPIRRRRTARDLIITVALFAIFLAAIDSVRRMPIGRYKSVYSAIQLGMTKAEVEAIVQREFPSKKPAIVPYEAGVVLNLGPVDSLYNAKVIVVEMTNGGVTNKEYHPD